MKYLAYPLVVAILYVAFAMGCAEWNPFAWQDVARYFHAFLQVSGVALVAIFQFLALEK